MPSFVFSLAFCVVFILSLFVSYFVSPLVTIKLVSIVTIGYQLDEH